MGLWKSLPGKFIQKEGVMNVTISLMVFLVNFPCQLWRLSYSNKKRWLFTWCFWSKDTFPFVDILLCNINSCNFLLKIVNFLWTFFSSLEVHIYSKYALHNLDCNFVTYIYHIYLKFNDPKINCEKIVLITKHYYCINVILKSFSNNSSFKYNRIWGLESWLCRWSNGNIIRNRSSTKFMVKNLRVQSLPCEVLSTNVCVYVFGGVWNWNAFFT